MSNTELKIQRLPRPLNSEAQAIIKIPGTVTVTVLVSPRTGLVLKIPNCE